MPILNRLAKAVARPFPRMISPRAHAIVDYITTGSLMMSAGFFWRQNKRASLAALIAAGSQLALDLLTDYPGGVKKVISFRTHSEIDLGLAAMMASMPEFLAFNNDHGRKLFLAQGALITAVNELTKLPDTI
jgi:hypothetical protein